MEAGTEGRTGDGKGWGITGRRYAIDERGPWDSVRW